MRHADLAQPGSHARSASTGWQPEKLNPRAASLADGPVTPIGLQGAALAIFGCPTRAFMPKEIAALHGFVDQVGCPRSCCLTKFKHSQGCKGDTATLPSQGGALMVFACAADSSEADVSLNLNQLLGRYSIAVNRDALFSIVQQVGQPLCITILDRHACQLARHLSQQSRRPPHREACMLHVLVGQHLPTLDDAGRPSSQACAGVGGPTVHSNHSCGCAEGCRR